MGVREDFSEIDKACAKLLINREDQQVLCARINNLYAYIDRAEVAAVEKALAEKAAKDAADKLAAEKAAETSVPVEGPA